MTPSGVGRAGEVIVRWSNVPNQYFSLTHAVLPGNDYPVVSLTSTSWVGKERVSFLKLVRVNNQRKSNQEFAS